MGCTEPVVPGKTPTSKAGCEDVDGSKSRQSLPRARTSPVLTMVSMPLTLAKSKLFAWLMSLQSIRLCRYDGCFVSVMIPSFLHMLGGFKMYLVGEVEVLAI